MEKIKEHIKNILERILSIQIKNTTLIVILVISNVFSVFSIIYIVFKDSSSSNSGIAIDTTLKNRPVLTDLAVSVACKTASESGWGIDEKIKNNDDSYSLFDISCQNTDEMALVDTYTYNPNSNTVQIEYIWKKPDDYENSIIGIPLRDACSLFEPLGWTCFSAGISYKQRKNKNYVYRDFDMDDPNALVDSYSFSGHTVFFYTNPESYTERTGESLIEDSNNSSSKRSVIKR